MIPSLFLRRPNTRDARVVFVVVLLLIVNTMHVHAFTIPTSKSSTFLTTTTTKKAKQTTSINNVLSSYITTTRHRQSSSSTSTSSLLLLQALPTDIVELSTVAGTATSVNSNSILWTYFWQVVIQNGVPALFTILIIGFGAWQFRPRKDGSGKKGPSFYSSEYDDDDALSSNPIALLYDDLYGDQDQDPFQNKKKRRGFFSNFMDRTNNNKPKLPKNTGVPKQQYIKVTNVNTKYDSYQYSIEAATSSKAQAASNYRTKALQNALGKVLTTTSAASTKTMDLTVWSQLQKLEQAYLQRIVEYNQLITNYNNELLSLAIQDELQYNLGIDKKDIPALLTQIDPKINISTKITTNNNTTATATAATNNETTTITATNETTTVSTTSSSSSSSSISSSSKRTTLMNGLQKVQKDIQELEIEFIQRIINIVGPEYAAGIQAALVGSGGSILSIAATTGERPLQRIFGSSTSNEDNFEGSTTDIVPTRKKKLYVMNFPGDVSASQVSELRQLVTSIVIAQQAEKEKYGEEYVSDNEALVILQSGGGTVTGYGLAAAQLLRLKEQAGLKLTICVEQVAASGGYMMACIADKIIASPFAVLGSIGVISDIPNVYERLKQEGIEFQTVTAGKYKRTLTPTKKVTKDDYEKTKKDIEEIYYLFRNFVKQNRPQLDIDAVATGETWFGTDALERNLCDEIKTVDDVLTDYVTAGYDVFQLEYKPPVEESPLGKLLQPSSSSSSIIEQPIRWFVRTLATAIRDEVSNNNNLQIPINERYMMKDDTADRVRSEDR